MRITAQPILASLVLLVASMHAAVAQQTGFLYYQGQYQTIAVPGATQTEPLAINNEGLVVGSALGSVWSGFSFLNGAYTTYTLPGYSFVSLQAANNNNEIIGYGFSDAYHGLILSGGNYTQFDAGTGTIPDAIGGGTTPVSINSSGDIVGFTSITTLPNYATTDYGFIKTAAGTSVLQPDPNEFSSFLVSINDAGEAVGYYTTQSNGPHSFTYENGVIEPLLIGNDGQGTAIAINNKGDIIGADDGFGVLLSGGTETKIVFPGSVNTIPTAINNFDDIVGFYITGAPGDYKYYGFLYADGQMSTISLANSDYTIVTGINDVGEIVGYSAPAPPPPIPEPSTWAMMLLGFAGLGFAGYRASRKSEMERAEGG